jgi:hypothetical protein
LAVRLVHQEFRVSLSAELLPAAALSAACLLRRVHQVLQAFPVFPAVVLPPAAVLSAVSLSYQALPVRQVRTA